MRVDAESADGTDVERFQPRRGRRSVARVDTSKIAFDSDAAEIVAGGVDIADICQPVAVGAFNDGKRDVRAVKAAAAEIELLQLASDDIDHPASIEIAGTGDNGDFVAVHIGVVEEGSRGDPRFEGLNPEREGAVFVHEKYSFDPNRLRG